MATFLSTSLTCTRPHPLFVTVSARLYLGDARSGKSSRSAVQCMQNCRRTAQLTKGVKKSASGRTLIQPLLRGAATPAGKPARCFSRSQAFPVLSCPSVSVLFQKTLTETRQSHVFSRCPQLSTRQQQYQGHERLRGTRRTTYRDQKNVCCRQKLPPTCNV